MGKGFSQSTPLSGTSYRHPIKGREGGALTPEPPGNLDIDEPGGLE